MNLSPTAPLVIVALAVSGCLSSSESGMARGPYVKPNLVMLTADQAAQRGIKIEAAVPAKPPMPKGISVLDSSAVVAPADVKVYVINRAADQADPDLMHEEHVVYRRESSPRWRLEAPVEQKILIGPRITDGRQDLQPLLSKELSTFLTDQRRATEANQQAITALFQAVDAVTRQQETLIRRERSTGKPASQPAETAPAADPAPREGP